MKFKISVKIIIKAVVLIFVIVIAINSCKKDEKELSKINIYLTDSPALYSGLNIEINSVSFLTTKAKQEKEFDTVYSGNYDLFKFSNGIDTLLACTELSPQNIYNIRIILGTNNYVIENGLKVPLITDLTSSIVFYPDIKLIKDEILNIWLDIDAFKSIIKKQDGTIALNPVFRFFEKKKTGSIRGIVLPENARTYVSAFNQTDTFSSIANEIGLFMIQGITPGKYALKFSPQRGDLLEGTVDDSLEVKADSSIYIGSVVLN